MLSEQRKIILQFLLSALFIGLGIWFFYHERSELSKVTSELAGALPAFVLAGVIITGLYIFNHSFMYRSAFAALGEKIPLTAGLMLFLKRNFISVFLPAGGVSSLSLIHI